MSSLLGGGFDIRVESWIKLQLRHRSKVIKVTVTVHVFTVFRGVTLVAGATTGSFWMGTFPVTSPSSTGWSISGGSTLQFIDPTNLLQSWHVISPNTEYHITYYLLLVYYFDLLWHRILISLILVLHIGPKSECIALFAFLNQKSFLDIHQPKPPAPLFNQKSFPYIHESFVQLVPPTNQISETDFRHVLLGLPTPQPPLRGYVLGSVRASYLIVIFSWKAILVGGFSPTHLKNMRTVKLDHFPRVSG